jgi:putative nucleotidyltransferase with HDIG domain
MNSLSIIGGSAESKEFLRSTLSGIFDSKFVEFSDIGQSTPGSCTLVDVDLNNVRYVPFLKKWLEHKPTGAKVVFITDKTSRSQAERAFAIGASDIVHRPIQSADLLAKLLGDVECLSGCPPSKEIRSSPGSVAAIGGLRKIFSSAIGGERVDFASLHSAGEPLVDELEGKGLAAWINAIRTHHSQTYQHCLMVTGLLVAFGQQLEVSRSDRIRLSMAGMLHDIGKARVSVAILEKRGPLTEEEASLLRQHPQFGLDALADAPGFPPEMLDVVIHHHEYLDGTGYPHGLKADEISDLVRMVTIADVFAAMIEWRSVRAPMSSAAAYKVLLDMGPKLDQELVREFEAVARKG